MFSGHLLDPKFFTDSQEHGVLIPHLLEDCHGHVRHFMSGAIEVGPNSFLQVGPSLAICPSHADPVLVHPVPELRHRLARVLLAAPGLLAGNEVDDPRGPAVDGRVDSGHGSGHSGLDHLALLDKVVGRAVPTLLHSFTVTLGPDVRVRGR